MVFLATQMSVSPAHSQSSEEHLNNDAYQFFAHYLNAYNNFDGKAAAAHYHEKVSVTGIGNILRDNTNQDMQNLLGAFLQRVKAQGVAKFEWETLQVSMLGENTAMASNIAARYKKDGSLHDRAAATFIAQNTEGGWKIFSLHIHSTEHVLNISKGK